MQIKGVQFEHLTQKPIKLTQIQDYSEKLKELPDDQLKYFFTLHEKTEKEPKRTYNEIFDFLKRYPTIPEALALLAYNHIQRRKVARADETIAFNYKHNPEHLLTRINYADYCLRRKRPEMVAEIFEDVYDLAELYPEREMFHIEEYRAFHTVIAQYYYDIEHIEIAENHLLLASNVAPKHPSIISLARKIYKGKGHKR